MTIITKTINENDNTLTYYGYHFMNRINGNLRYYNVLESNFEATEIIDGVYLGSLESSYDINTLKKKALLISSASWRDMYHPIPMISITL